MRSKYRLYVCPEPSCAAIGRSDQTCPTHEEAFVAIIVVREDQVQKLKDAAEKVRQAGERVAGRDPNSPLAKTMDEALKSVSDILRGVK